MDIRFDGKRALVTVGGRGMGGAVALKLVELGAHVLVVDILNENLERLKSKAPTIETRCLDDTAWEATRQCITELCPIDLLVNSAGIIRGRSVLESTKDDIDSIMDVNFNAMFNISQIDRPHVQFGAKVTKQNGGNVQDAICERENFGKSYKIQHGNVKMVVANDMISRGSCGLLRKHYFDSKLFYLDPANCVAPAIVITDMGRDVCAIYGMEQAKLTKGIPSGDFPEIDDVVDAVIYLLSDKSKMISGATLPVDGAQLATL